MKSQSLYNFIRDAVVRVPRVKPFLSNKARYVLCSPEAYKSQSYFLEQIERLVRSVHAGLIGGDFIDVMANLISGQLYDAYGKAWFDYGEEGNLPSYLNTAYQDDVLAQYEHVDKFYRDIIDARVDNLPVEPLLARARMWANQWTSSYNKANGLIQVENGGNLIWQYGETEHCETCQALNGIIASAKEWAAAGVRPQNAPNSMIDCKGFNCRCELTPTDKRRSPKAFDSILNIVVGRGL